MAVHPWDPATEAEAAMRDALAAADQDRYFRILSRSDLLLPVSAEALAGRAPMGWGTWTTGERTHILAFTSPAALRLCLNEPGGTYRSVAFPALATEWPNYEWWLAINPGLPIEAYLPSWFIAQIVRAGGEVRLPGRTAGGARARMATSDLAAAISGRIRATGSSGAAAARARPRDSQARRPEPAGYARDGFPRDGLGREGGLGRRLDEAGYQREDVGYARSHTEPAGTYPGYASPGLAPTNPAAASVRPPFGRAALPALPESPEPYREPVTARLAAPGVPPPVETVDAEIVSAEGDGGYEPGAYHGPEPSAFGRTAGYGGPRDESTTRFAERDLGARLREQQAYAGAAAGRAEPSAAEPTSWTPRRAVIEDAEIVSPTEAWAVGFVPANETESDLLAAAETNNTDSFLSTLLLARVILPVPISMPPGSRPRDKYFPWQIEEADGERLIAVFTSPERLADYGAEHFGPDISTMSMRFIELIEAWPSERIQFAINPGTPVGTTLPGSQIVALASWAAEVGLRDEPAGEVVVAARKHEASLGVAGAPAVGASKAIIMQRTVPPTQVAFYLERGYDRVSGFVNRASEVSHLKSPRLLYRALGLLYQGSPFAEDDTEVHVLRWVAHRPDLYRLPYGGQTEAAMRAMQGWVIERAPFRGNGFAPGDTDVVAEFKVDSARLPHGAQMWRLARDGSEELLASFDADSGRWVRTP
ncbi:MAG TPA: SseB family protein [Micromonosporaceae bacterium]